MKRGGPPGPDGDDLDGFMDEVAPEARRIAARHRVRGERAIRLLSHCWVVVARSEGNRASKRRQFLEAFENACRELRARLGPPSEEADDERIH